MIVHIGFPKCGSTSLQNLFAGVDATFLGCNPKEKPGAFYAPELGFFFESIFRFGTERQFGADAENIRSYLQRLEESEDGRVILSNENLSLRLTPWDLPTDIKIQRLGSLIPPRSQIIIVFRPIQDFIVSLYKNHLSFGYTADFKTFIQEIVLLKEYGVLADLILENLCQNITENFDNPEIVLLDLKAPNSLERLLSHLDLKLENAKDIEDVRNPSPSAEETAAILEHNQALPSRKRFLDWLENHRVFPQGTMDDEDLFWISRNRISQKEYTPQNTPSDSFDPASIQWPDVFGELEQKNQAFLQSLSSKDRITLIASD